MNGEISSKVEVIYGLVSLQTGKSSYEVIIRSIFATPQHLTRPWHDEKGFWSILRVRYSEEHRKAFRFETGGMPIPC